MIPKLESTLANEEEVGRGIDGVGVGDWVFFIESLMALIPYYGLAKIERKDTRGNYIARVKYNKLTILINNYITNYQLIQFTVGKS